MPVTVTYPGVYIEELPSTEKTVTGVSTSTTAFVDFFARGPLSTPDDPQAVQIFNYRDFQRTFGGLDARSEASYGISQFFLNGGETAFVVRVDNEDSVAAERQITVNVPKLSHLAQQATDAAKAAADAAKAARKAAGAADSTDLVEPKDAMTAATEAQNAADETEKAAKAAAAASQVLEVRIRQADALGGALAKLTTEAARNAATAAEDAQGAADSAKQQATTAAGLVTVTNGKESLSPDKEGEAKVSAVGLVNAAVDAAKKAGVAAEKATAALLAAEEAGDAAAEVHCTIMGANPGVWGNQLKVQVTSGASYEFDMLVELTEIRHGKEAIVDKEVHRGLSLQDSGAKNYALQVINHQSRLIRLAYNGPAIAGTSPIETPDATSGNGANAPVPLIDSVPMPLSGGNDGTPPPADRLVSTMRAALDHIAPQVFNILALPITGTYSAMEANAAISGALTYCKEKRAFMIVDIPESVRTPDDMASWMNSYGNAENFSGAVYYPRLIMPDSLQDYRPRNVAASGTLAGVYARTDSSRGVWKAPAGVEAVLEGVEVAYKLTDDKNGVLNQRGVNCLRSFPVFGNISWGARTLAGADQLQSQFKYVNVRRLIDYIEESLFQALKWAVFEPNDEELWLEIRQQVGGFLSGLFVDGAFAGKSADSAYFVHCDETTTTPVDIANGIVNIVVGIAPVKPAEFVILQIQQIAGQE